MVGNDQICNNLSNLDLVEGMCLQKICRLFKAEAKLILKSTDKPSESFIDCPVTGVDHDES
jgi:hypothetical protein